MATLYWTDHYGRRWPVCECLKAWLPAWEKELLRRGLIRECIDLYQTIGTASASAGTHSRGGCVDARQSSREQLRVARNMGGAGWERDNDPNDGQPNMSPRHAHIALKGCPHMVDMARRQVTSCENGRNGLAGNGPDDGPRADVKWPLRTWREGIAWAQNQEAPVTNRYPADIFGKNWKLTIPFDGPDADSGADEIRQPRLATYSGPACRMNTAGDSVVFTVHHGAPTTSGSKNPRSELREMRPGGLDEITWDGRRGRHRLKNVDLAINHLTVVKPHVVVAQIHGEDDDVTVLRGEGVKGTNRIKMWLTKGDDTHAFSLGEVRLTQRFRFGFDVSEGKVRFDWNGARQLFTVPASAGSYFKVGCYLQSNYATAPSESSKAYAQVRMFSRPEVSHVA